MDTGYDSVHVLGRPFSALTAVKHFNSIPTSRRICRYDVFISFRGTDTRNTFTDHLYNHLIRKGIFVFKDDKLLEKGQPISPQLLQAIKDSRVSIIVFSKDYASSTWCLEEMATIADCMKEFRQTVFPVFYDVDPSHVRKQSGKYAEAFAEHNTRFEIGKVDRWMGAMTDLAGLVGWDVRDKPESKEIEKLVQVVTKTLDHEFSGLADDLIGIQPRVEGLEKLLKLDSVDDDFRVLGIWGMSGIGKSTHATVLYDKISYQFDVTCFIQDVRKTYRDGDAIAIQKQILRLTLDEKNLDTYSPSEISKIIISRLHNIKVLVVLDNVDQLEQLQELDIKPKLLHTGSRMIITTTDKHILEVYGVDAIYEVPVLNHNDARELFCTNAFKYDGPSGNRVELIPEVLKYVQCLPLAIKVIGSFLCSRDAIQWRDALDGLRNNPDKKIMDVLQISIEGLEPTQRDIFLHIACFFNGEMEDYVKRILECCGLHPHIGIPVLTEKSLISIRNQEIHMHELLQHSGMKIVRQQSPDEPESWSRLWRYQDFHDVMMTETVTNRVKAIVLNQKENVSVDQSRVEELSKMRSLKLLILHHKNFSGSLDSLSSTLQYFHWHGYPFTYLPSNFPPKRLVELNMPDSSVERLWQGVKHLPSLKRMDLSNSKSLTETPNFEGTPKLERLDLTGCTNLSQLHPSIGSLKKLAFLSLRNCSNVVSLDFGGVLNLSSLRVLYLSGCTKLENTPNFTGLVTLEHLDLEQCTSLTMVHESIGDLKQLKFLSLRHCTNLVNIPNSIHAMRSLTTLDLCGCVKLMNLPLSKTMEFPSILGSLIFLDVRYCNLREVPDAIGKLRCLERLNLEGNKFVSLPFAISLLSNLAYLNLSHCHELQYVPALSSNNYSPGGRYFKTVSGSRNHRSGLYIFNCPNLTDNYMRMAIASKGTRSECWPLKWLKKLVKDRSRFRCGFDIVIPGSVIPEWFNHRFKGDSTIRILDSNAVDNWSGFAFCVAFEVNNRPTTCASPHDSFSPQLPHPFYLSFESEPTEESFEMPLSLKLDKIDGSKSKHLWLIYISRPHCHFVKTGACITFKACPGLEMKEWGLRMVNPDRMHRGLWRQKREAAAAAAAAAAEAAGGAAFQEFLEQKAGAARAAAASAAARRAAAAEDCRRFEYVHESSSSSSGPKIQLPYNWFVTDEEEKDNIHAKGKENRFSTIGF